MCIRDRSTAIQWPPTPGPGFSMSTLGCILANSMTSQTSTFRLSQIIDISFAKAMLLSLNAFSESLMSSAVLALVAWHLPEIKEL